MGSGKRWSKRLALGIDEIDREHEEIHRLIDLLQDALRAGERDTVQREIVQTVLGQVMTFAQKHFAYEERLMKKVSFPEFDDHKNEHEFFLQQIRELKGKLQTGGAPPTSQTMNALSNWIQHHVLETDKKYVPYLFSWPPVGRNAQDGTGTPTLCARVGQNPIVPAMTPGSQAPRK